MGGLTPRDLPSTRISPQGLIENWTLPVLAAGAAVPPGIEATGPASDAAPPGDAEPITGGFGADGNGVPGTPAATSACRSGARAAGIGKVGRLSGLGVATSVEISRVGVTSRGVIGGVAVSAGRGDAAAGGLGCVRVGAGLIAEALSALPAGA